MNAVAPKSQLTKILAGTVLGGVAAGALLISHVTLFVFVLALLLVAGGELFRVVRRRGAPPLPLAGFGTIAACAALAFRGPEALLAGIPAVGAACIGVTLMALVVRRRIEGALSSVATTVFASLYVSLGSFVIAMRETANGFQVVLTFGLMACLNDSFAYFVGRSAGRHPVAKSISPEKTWEGLAGGTAATFAVAGLAAWKMSPPFGAGRALVLAALVCVAMPLGDLAESALKREAGVKDSTPGGLGGQGGVLDRLDGLLFAAPIFYFAYRAMVR